MRKRIADMPALERTRMLSFRITPAEQRRVRLRAAIAGRPVCELLRAELSRILGEDAVVPAAAPDGKRAG